MDNRTAILGQAARTKYRSLGIWKWFRYQAFIQALAIIPTIRTIRVATADKDFHLHSIKLGSPFNYYQERVSIIYSNILF